MKIEDLKNTKIYLPNEDDRVRFQKKVFNLGVRWRYSSSFKVNNLDCRFLYIDKCLRLTTDSQNNPMWFIEKKHTRIFLDEVLSIEEPKKKCEFKPFDKVLVRDYIDIGKWIPRLFAEYDGDARYGKYETTDGNCYNFCIPYEGNEHLVGTNLKQ